MDLSMKQVDYTNAFAQAKLKPDETIYVELLCGFESSSEAKQVLKLITKVSMGCVKALNNSLKSSVKD